MQKLTQTVMRRIVMQRIDRSPNTTDHMLVFLMQINYFYLE